MCGAIVPMRSSRVTVHPHKYHRGAKPLIEQQRKERSQLWAVHLALQHLSGARHFRASARGEHDQDEPTTPASDLGQASPQRCSRAFLCVRSRGRSRGARSWQRHFSTVILRRRQNTTNPPAGQFLEVDGVRLHYVERGSGEPLVLLHGNGSMIQDFQIQRIGRPGRQELQGHHHRPPRFRPQQPATERHLDARCPGPVDPARARSSRCFTGHRTRALLGRVGRGGSCALKFPDFVRGLVLASGYYYPTLRPDVVTMSAPAIPVVGDVMGHTVSPHDQQNDVAHDDGDDLRTQVGACQSSSSFPRKWRFVPRRSALRPQSRR